jgi:hypothetical protein
MVDELNRRPWRLHTARSRSSGCMTNPQRGIRAHNPNGARKLEFVGEEAEVSRAEYRALRAPESIRRGMMTDSSLFDAMLSAFLRKAKVKRSLRRLEDGRCSRLPDLSGVGGRYLRNWDSTDASSAISPPARHTSQSFRGVRADCPTRLKIRIRSAGGAIGRGTLARVGQKCCRRRAAGRPRRRRTTPGSHMPALNVVGDRIQGA